MPTIFMVDTQIWLYVWQRNSHARRLILQILYTKRIKQFLQKLSIVTAINFYSWWAEHVLRCMHKLVWSVHQSNNEIVLFINQCDIWESCICILMFSITYQAMNSNQVDKDWKRNIHIIKCVDVAPKLLKFTITSHEIYMHQVTSLVKGTYFFSNCRL